MSNKLRLYSRVLSVADLSVAEHEMHLKKNDEPPLFLYRSVHSRRFEPPSYILQQLINKTINDTTE